jgi:hypothetical protein
MLIFYPLAFMAVWTRSVKLYSYFATYALIGLILEMFQAYADRYIYISKLITHRFDIIIFLMRFVAFVYARFLNQLVVSLLLLPR